MRICEVFVSLQGEGDTVGRPALFIRVQGCPLDCEWCDTKYSLSFDEGESKSVGEVCKIIEDFVKLDRGIVVFTGGEPLCYQNEISRILEVANPRLVEFETSGIYIPIEPLEKYKFNVSPKLSNANLSGGTKIYQKIYSNLKHFLKLNSIFKFVVSEEKDLEEVSEIVNTYNLPKHRVFLMPQGKTPEELVKRSKFIIPFCLETGLNYSTRLQVMLGIK